MSDGKTASIMGVKHVGEYLLRVRWANGKALTVDLRELVYRLKGMRPLRNATVCPMRSVQQAPEIDARSRQ